MTRIQISRLHARALHIWIMKIKTVFQTFVPPLRFWSRTGLVRTVKISAARIELAEFVKQRDVIIGRFSRSMVRARLVKITQSLIIMVGLADKKLAIHARFSRSMAHARLVNITQSPILINHSVYPNAMIPKSFYKMEIVQHVKPFTNLMKPNELV